MAKFYNESIPEKVTPLGPKDETVKFLLNFSKALNVIKIKNMTIETLNN